MQSIVQERGSVAFPDFTGERVYMREFRKADGLPFDLARWQPTIDAMLDGVDTDGPLYLMIDQGRIVAGNAHRRPGVHIDGYWNPAMQAHGGSGGGHNPQPNRSGGSHGGGGHSSRSDRSSGSHGGSRHSAGASNWAHATFSDPEAIILASDVRGCRALVGSYDGQVGDGGDCSRFDLAGLHEIIMAPNTIYAGNVTMLHESLPIAFDAMRTLVRINVPGWHPK